MSDAVCLDPLSSSRLDSAGALSSTLANASRLLWVGKFMLVRDPSLIPPCWLLRYINLAAWYSSKHDAAMKKINPNAIHVD